MKNIFSDKMLLLLADYVDTYDHIIGFHYIPPYLKRLPKQHASRVWLEKYLINKKKRQKIHNALANLKRRGYLQRKIFEKSHGYILTPKAETKIISLKLKNNREKFSESQQLLVFFDIPEKIKFTREIFRKRLKEVGFEQLQKSIWITSYNTTKAVKKMINEYKIEKFVQMLMVKNIKNS